MLLNLVKKNDTHLRVTACCQANCNFDQFSGALSAKVTPQSDASVVAIVQILRIRLLAFKKHIEKVVLLQEVHNRNLLQLFVLHHKEKRERLCDVV